MQNANMSISAGFAGCREMSDYMHISSNAVNFLFRCVAVRKRCVSFRRGSLLALRSSPTDETSGKQSKQAKPSQAKPFDARPPSAKHARRVRSRQRNFTRSVTVTVRHTWMKCCFWLITRRIPWTLSSRQTVLVLCCLFCFFVTSHWRWSVYFVHCRLFTVSPLNFNLFMYRPADVLCVQQIAPWTAFYRTKVARMQSKLFLCQYEYWVKVVYSSTLCLPALVMYSSLVIFSIIYFHFHMSLSFVSRN